MKLTSEQIEAVEHDQGPLLIIAGAGTGKTMVITHRIAHLIGTKKARPGEILALTFTEKAAKEMEERVDQLVPYGYTDVWISTFHAFGDRLLRENAISLGLSPAFRVLTRPERCLHPSRGKTPSIGPRYAWWGFPRGGVFPKANRKDAGGERSPAQAV